MNDTEFEQQQQRIQSLADRWLQPLGLDAWTIRHKYERSHGPVEDVGQCTQSVVVMSCYADWRYERATITIYVEEIADLTDEELEEHYVHELAHILLSEMRQAKEDDWLDHEERSATWLMKTLLRLRSWAEQEGRRAESPRLLDLIAPEPVS